MGQTPPVARIQQRNGFRFDDEQSDHMDMDEAVGHEGNEADHTMLWQSDAGDDVQDVNMLDLANQAGPSSRDSVNLRPAVFNPPDDHWNWSSTRAVQGLERLFEQGVSLQDSRMPADAPKPLGRTYRRLFGVSVVTIGMLAILAGFYVYRRSVVA